MYPPLLQASAACRDLLRQMLTAEPSKRITIPGIMNHPWFLKDLPQGTHEMNARLQASDNVRCAGPPPYGARRSRHACKLPL